jgi:hypothetical protein
VYMCAEIVCVSILWSTVPVVLLHMLRWGVYMCADMVCASVLWSTVPVGGAPGCESESSARWCCGDKGGCTGSVLVMTHAFD